MAARWDAETARLRARMEQDAARLVRLGPRVVAELLYETGTAHAVLPEIAERLARYASLSPIAVCAAGAGQLSGPRPRLVPATHRATR